MLVLRDLFKGDKLFLMILRGQDLKCWHVC